MRLAAVQGRARGHGLVLLVEPLAVHIDMRWLVELGSATLHPSSARSAASIATTLFVAG